MIQFPGSPPAGLGLASGRLAPCPERPNCVSSRATSATQAVAPLAYDGSADTAWRRLCESVQALGRATIVENARVGGTRYLRVEFRSSLLGFVDDAEFALDEDAEVIHVRSASRLGRLDFGVNRSRIERIRSGVSQGVPR
jgi:uncharacterized protein (DUF1499 family)